MERVLQWILVSLLLTAVSFCICADAVAMHTQSMAPKVGENEAGKLEVITLLPNKLEATYYQTAREGIYFLSENQENSDFLLITTLEGEQLYMVDRLYNSILYSVSDSNFFINMTTTETKRHMTGYAIPPSYQNKVKNAVKKQTMTRRLLNHLDAEGVNATRTSAFEHFLQRPEVRMIIEAAMKLGNDMQVTGDRYPAARTFYVLAMRLNKFQDEQFQTSEGASGETIDDHIVHRGKRSHCSPYCSNSGYCCASGSCPIGSNCLGMCGRRCDSCWWWVCQTCCYQQGCYDHDVCCQDWWSWGCLVPLGFSCDSYSC